MDRIARDPTTVVCPVIDVISDKTFEYHFRGDASAINVGGFDWNLQFNWHGVPERERKRRKSSTDPVRYEHYTNLFFVITIVQTIYLGYAVSLIPNLFLSLITLHTFIHLCMHLYIQITNNGRRTLCHLKGFL